METTMKMTGSRELLDLLNITLDLEYTLIVYYPRIASIIQDDEIKQLAQSLGIASIGHADTVARTIINLGGTPHWSFESFPDEINLKTIFEVQFDKEKFALKLHQQVVALVTDSSTRDKFIGMVQDEESHIKTVEQILERLSKLSRCATAL
jgi:bacterioferritin (cytochrome b1)